DLATTLDAIYGRGDRGVGIPGTQTPRGGSGVARDIAGGPIPPLSPPPIPPVSPGAVPVSLTPDALMARPEIRFIADEVTHAVIVTTYPRLWQEIQETTNPLEHMPPPVRST